MKFKQYSQNSIMLLPPSFEESLPKDHFCFIVNDIVESLNLSCTYGTYKDGGALAYDPRLLVKVLFYAYSQGIRSSRKIENNLYENIAFRFLSGNAQLDHGTISLFRKSHLHELPQIFAQIVVLASSLGLADLSDISIDGTKIKASASRKKLYNREEIEKLTVKIEEIISAAEELDQKEDQQYGNRRGVNQLPEKLANPGTRVKEITRLKAKLEKLDEAKTKIAKK